MKKIYSLLSFSIFQLSFMTGNSLAADCQINMERFMVATAPENESSNMEGNGCPNRIARVISSFAGQVVSSKYLEFRLREKEAQLKISNSQNIQKVNVITVELFLEKLLRIVSPLKIGNVDKNFSQIISFNSIEDVQFSLAPSRLPLKNPGEYKLKMFEGMHSSPKEDLEFGKWELKFTLLQEAEVWVANGKINAGEELSRELFEAKKVYLDKSTDHYFPTSSRPAFYKSTAIMAEGSYLENALMTKMILIPSGVPLNLDIENNGITISTTATANTSGRYGDVITFKIGKKGKIISAKVMGKNKVNINL